MNKIIAVMSFAAVIAGCSCDPEPTEAERFGYKGRDLENQDEKMFFSTGPGVTNWVPSRVLMVSERYDFTSNELALVSAAGVITPAESFEKLPDGFTAMSREPWFTTWAKDTEAFGKKGSAGFISHYNDAKRLWETGEAYFSTYYGSESEAVKALAELEPEVSKFGPMKFHRFDNCWVAEFLRLRVMGLCGQRADGTWTCMLSVNDKCNSGCGPWEPVEAQQERVDEIAFRAEVKAWREVVDRRSMENHAAVTNKAASAGLPLFGEEAVPQAAGDGRMLYVVGGLISTSNTVGAAVWEAKIAELTRASGVTFGEREAVSNDVYEIWTANGSNDLFTVRLDMAFPVPATNDVAGAERGGQWRGLCFENIQPGFEPPPAPQRKKR